MKRHVIDRVLAKMGSRKLLLAITATVLLCVELIAPGDWLVVVAMWLGVQGAVDLLDVRARIPRSVARAADDPEAEP